MSEQYDHEDGPNVNLATVISESFKVDTSSEDFEFLYGYAISYVTKGTSAFEYQRLIKPFCKDKGFSAKVFRLRLHKSRYFSLTIKLFFLRLAEKKSVDKARVKLVSKELGVPLRDAKLMYAIWTDHSAFRARIKRELRSIPEDKRDLLNDVGLTRYFNAMYDNIFKYVKYMTYKKLRFIAKSSNLELGDLHNDILAKVVQSYYSLVPIVLPDLHVQNYLKRAVHNYVMNRIKAETTQKRGRLVNTGVDHENNRVFSLRMVSENQLILGPDAAETSYTDMQEGTTESLTTFELQFSVAEILTKLDQRGKKYRLLTILMGNEDTEFTQWLQNRGMCRPNEDNVDVQSKMSVKDFNRLLSEFLHVSEIKLNVFLFRLRKDLALDAKCTTKELASIATKQLKAA